MKTRRIVLCLIALLTLSLLFVACAPTDGAEKNGELSLTDEVPKVTLRDTVYKIIYNGDKVNESGIIRDFNTSLNAKTGKAYERTPYEGEIVPSAIVVGTLEDYEGYTTLKERTSEFASAALGSFAIAMNGGKTLQIVASDSASLKAGCEYFVANLCEADSEITIDETFSVCILFNKNDYFTKGEITKIDTTTVTADATLASITVDGTAIDGFSGDVKSYTVNGVPYATRYPTVGAVPVFAGATVSVTQASDENGGVATITVTGRDPKGDDTYNTETYTVTFVLDETSESAAEIVWRGGAQGVVTFVIDDGDHETADFVLEEMLHKYSALRVSYALIMKNLATIKTTADGTAYEMTEDNKYVYTADQDEVNFWRSHLAANNYCELLSHSWTHLPWGQNDDGGEQQLTDYNGTNTKKETFPKGHITMELAASKQLLVELFSQDARYFIMPGTGMKPSQYYLDLLTGGTIYSAGRTTQQGENKTWNKVEDFASAYSSINAYMIASTESPTEWTDFIDRAIADGTWATFCIHKIVADNYPATGHYIYQKNADILFNHANTLASEGKLWIATMTEATDYARLRNYAKVTAETFRDERVEVTLTVDGLPSNLTTGESLDHISLTVKVAVPSDWSGTVAASNGASAEVQTDASGNFVYIDIVPSDAAVTLTRAN